MDKKKIRKDLTNAHKAIKPLSSKLSHKDLKHVNDGMNYIKNALVKTGDTAQPDKFLNKAHVSVNPKTHVWMKLSDGVVAQMTTNDTFSVLHEAKKYIKMNY